MIILHDNLSSDLSHIQAMGLSWNHGFALFDYIRIEQNGTSWIGQIVQRQPKCVNRGQSA